MSQQKEKRNLAIWGRESASSYKVIGLGAGSTVNMLVDEISQLPNPPSCVSASSSTSRVLVKKGILEISFNAINNLPITFDGADAIIQQENKIIVLKGIGGALTNEKLLWMKSETIKILVDQSKLDKALVVIVVAVLPKAYLLIEKEIELLLKNNGSVQLRVNERLAMPFISDNGLYHFHITINVKDFDIVQLHNDLKKVTGVVETGIFSESLIDKTEIIIARGDEVLKLKTLNDK